MSRHYQRKKPEDAIPHNHQIKSQQIRLIDQNNNQVGVVSKEKAIQFAQDANLDLVQISVQNDIAICRITNLGKFIYERKKKEQQAKKKQKITQMKGVNFRVNIDDNDYSRKLQNIIQFLKSGDQVKVMVRFFGRENIYPEVGIVIMRKLIDDLIHFANYKGDLKKQGNSITVIFTPKLST